MKLRGDYLLKVLSPQQRIESLIEEPIEKDWVRVPLDVHRQNMRSLQWRPLFLSEWTTSGQLDLLNVICEIKEVQTCR